MKSNIKALLAAAGVTAFAFSPASAYEGGVQWQQKPGVFIGASAGVPPPGIYMFDQVFTYQTNLAGPVQSQVGNKQGVQAAVDVQGFLFVPGWTFLGATYDAVIAQPFGMVSVGKPLSLEANQIDMFSGVHNTYFAPVELSWKLGTSGFVVKAGLGIFAPTGTIQGGQGPNTVNLGCTTQVGCNGFANFGNKYWTFQPELILSYLKDGWNLSAAFTANSIRPTRSTTTPTVTSSTSTSRPPRPSASGPSVRSATTWLRSRMTSAPTSSVWRSIRVSKSGPLPSSRVREVSSATPSVTSCSHSAACSNTTSVRRA